MKPVSVSILILFFSLSFSFLNKVYALDCEFIPMEVPDPTGLSLLNDLVEDVRNILKAKEDIPRASALYFAGWQATRELAIKEVMRGKDVGKNAKEALTTAARRVISSVEWLNQRPKQFQIFKQGVKRAGEDFKALFTQIEDPTSKKVVCLMSEFPIVLRELEITELLLSKECSFVRYPSPQQLFALGQLGQDAMKSNIKFIKQGYAGYQDVANQIPYLALRYHLDRVFASSTRPDLQEENLKGKEARRICENFLLQGATAYWDGYWTSFIDSLNPSPM